MDLQERSKGVREASRWLTPNPRLPEGMPTIVSALFSDVRDELLAKLSDGTQLVLALRYLTHAKDAAVRQAIADGDPE
jgi:hypothetical protein